jgi:predicted RNA-binding protein YlqC (UPF0109 family)
VLKNEQNSLTTKHERGYTVVLELSVARVTVGAVSSDIGNVIGKKGQNIGAIRTVINAASGKMHKRIIVEVLE